jgi:predicted lipid carrier protein YhbT
LFRNDFIFSERERNRLRAQKALASGKTREAEQFFQKAIEITPDMVLNVIQVRNSLDFMSIFRCLGSSKDGY